MPGSMNIERALSILGLSATDGLEQASKAFRDLSKDLHPDSPDGSHDDQVELSEAYEAVKAHLSGRALVPLDVKRAVTVFERTISRQSGAQLATRYSVELTRRRTASVQRVKYLAFLLASVAGLLGFLDILSDLPVSLKSSLKTMTIVFGSAGGLLQFLVQRQAHLLDALNARLDDDRECIRLLRSYGVDAQHAFTASEILFAGQYSRRDRYNLPPPGLSFEEREVYDRILRHRKRFGVIRYFMGGSVIKVLAEALLIILTDDQKVQLTILKGMEHGILEQDTASRPVGGLSERKYRVTKEFQSEFT